MDLLAPTTQRMITDQLRGPGDALWHSSPCTGGCGWQRINMTLGESTRQKVLNHWSLFRKLWTAFENVANIAIERGVSVFIEWPKSCAYWHDKQVTRFLTNWGFATTVFDGCMYGLQSTNPRTVGMPIKKPWRVDYVNSNIGEYLNVRCDGSHQHAVCRGKDAIMSQCYTVSVVVLLNLAIHQWACDPDPVTPFWESCAPCVRCTTPNEDEDVPNARLGNRSEQRGALQNDLPT